MAEFRGEKRVTAEEEALTAGILGVAITVHRILGPGYLESIYHRAMERELSKAEIAFESEQEITVLYDGLKVGDHRLDLLVESKVIVELKAVSGFTGAHYAQVRSYLRATHLHIGLLLNFADPALRVRRILNEHRPFGTFRPPE